MLLTQHGAIGHCIIIACFKNVAKKMWNFRSAPRWINFPHLDTMINSQCIYCRMLTVDSSSLTVSIKALGVNFKQATRDPSMLKVKGQAPSEGKLPSLKMGT